LSAWLKHQRHMQRVINFVFVHVFRYIILGLDSNSMISVLNVYLLNPVHKTNEETRIPVLKKNYKLSIIAFYQFPG
jgi:hypothetical protein